MPATRTIRASFSCHVLRGVDFVVTSGANLGDPLAEFDELCAGDAYRLQDGSETWQLAISGDPETARQIMRGGEEAALVAQGSEMGQPGALIRLRGRLTFMARDGDIVEVLLIALDAAGDGPRLHCALPLTPIAPKAEYTLIGINPEVGTVRWGDITSVAFQRGTLISLSSGMQVPIETLRKGDKILTRDDGAQPLRWIGHKTVRAVGAFAPVVISKGTMGNSNDLIVSQHQRLFVYQRGGDRLTETAEMLVKAKYLVDNDRVMIREGGFADYYSLVFDQHAVIYAESIPCESLEVNAATLAQIPDDLAQAVEAELPDLLHRTHYGTEANAKILAAARAKLFRPS